VPGSENFNVPQISFAQFFSPYAGVLAGKLDTTVGDANEFAHGKGERQFFNMAFGLNPVALTGPYSPLGAGVIVLPTRDPAEALLNVMVVQTDRLKSKEGSWSVYYNFDQYLYETDKAAGHGVGLFARFGASDGDPNLTNYFYSAGVGGKGLIPSRPNDQFGLGYYYTDVTNPTLQVLRQTRSFLRDEWGFEAYYNVALTPWLLLTPDIQVIGPAQKQRIVSLTQRESVDTAVALGVRAEVIF
jgi:carbohydrate-selective porin OprB